MVELADSAVSPKDIGTSPEDIAKRWHTEIRLARKSREKWLKKSERIINRYRDERLDAEDNRTKPAARFNVLWSNVQTLLPAVYAKAPKPVVERRFLDRDPIGRTASRILERCLMYTIEAGYYHDSVKKAVLDYLLPGQGVVWARYEPTYKDGPEVTETAPEQEDTPEEEYEAEQVVADENVCTDYVHYTDYLTNPSRTCGELRWVSRRSFLTRDELTGRFGKEIGKEVPLNYAPKDLADQKDKGGDLDEMFKKAEVWEIWNKDDRKIYFISEHFNKPLEVADDPLHLECFWPTPDPLLATVANDSIVPTPDYIEYQDQAMELDSLTGRITALTKAIKAVGVYDASVPALKRLLQEGTENTLYPIENWSEFSQKTQGRGLDQAVALLPIKEMAEVLIRLYEARAQVKADLYEITGISDIVRGQATQGGAKTATEQRIKGQFANLRLQDRQSVVANFARDQLKIIAEIIAEHFAPETLYLMSGYEQWGAEQFLNTPEHQPQQAPQQPPMGGPQQPPGPPTQPPGPPMGAPPQQPPGPPGVQLNGAPQMAMPPPPTPQQKAMEQFQAAVALLRKDKLRGFRVDIETDSTIEPDAQEEKQARVEFLGAVAQFLPQALEASIQKPEMAPLMGKMLLFGVRGFRVGRELESAMEETIAKLEQQAANPQPKPPSPEEIKVKGEMQKQEMESKRDQAKFAMEQQQGQQDLERKAQEGQMEMAFKQQEFELKQAELQLKREELDMKRQDMMLQSQIKEHEASIKLAAKEHETALNTEAMEHEHQLNADASQQKHDMGLEALEAKTAAAKQQAKQRPAAK